MRLTFTAPRQEAKMVVLDLLPMSYLSLFVSYRLSCLIKTWSTITFDSVGVYTVSAKAGPHGWESRIYGKAEFLGPNELRLFYQVVK